MIGRLRGTLLEKQPPELLLDVQGVGYEVHAPMTTFYDLPAVGSEVILYTHLVVREDAHTLFGFGKVTDRALFRALIKVNGVGAKLALTILSGMDTHAFVRCVQEKDVASLVRLPGVGKKTAERLVVEMADRLDDWQPADRPSVSGAKPGLAAPANPVEEAVGALIALGYKPPEASKMVRGIDCQDLAAEEIIRRALQATVK